MCEEEGETPTMPVTVTPQERQTAKREIVRDIEQGASTREARARSTVPMHRVTVYRLLKRVQREGERAFEDGRHGHPVKLRGEALTFVIEHSQAQPHIASSVLHRAMLEHFGSAPSISQLNRVRAGLGLSRRAVAQEKKTSNGPLH
jgi:transposase